MSQANSQTQIINKALVLCGAATVTSINDGTPNANALANVYEIALQSILSECKWNFATSRSTLSYSATTSTSPAFLYPGEKFVYQLPQGVIRIYDISPTGAMWREESGQIISDTANLGILYVYYDDNPNDYPSYFLDAFIDKLAGDIAYLVINSPQVAAAIMKKYETVTLPKARSANSQTGMSQRVIDDAWTSSKYFDRYGGPWNSYGCWY